MALVFRANQALFENEVTVEEAEGLLEWLQTKPTASADLSTCTRIHPANLQVLMAANVVISAWPADAALTIWLKSALNKHDAALIR